MKKFTLKKSASETLQAKFNRALKPLDASKILSAAELQNHRAKCADILQDSLPKTIVASIKQCLNSKADGILISGFPVDVNYMTITPSAIRQSMPSNIGMLVLLGLSGLSEKPLAAKRFEHTIRFRFNGDPLCNVEPWHNHPQYHSTIFFCQRGDAEAKTYMISATEIFLANPELKETFLEPYDYFGNGQPFALMERTGKLIAFSKRLSIPSPLKGRAPDLDLGDAEAVLCDFISSSVRRPQPQTLAITALVKALQKPSQNEPIIYRPGDVAIYNENTTMRYSPAFKPSALPTHERWLQSLSLEP
jgi:hypothetical protein